MTTTLTSATLPSFRTGLINLSHCLKKAAAHAEKRGFSADAYIPLRFAPDMLPFASQIRIACDSAKNGTARASGLEAPRFADDETTFVQLQERIDNTLAWLELVPPDAFDGRETMEITFPVGKNKTRTVAAAVYLRRHALSNFFFHVVVAYSLLRQSGVDLGKTDYMLGAES